jgi:hypothetical protein
MVPKSSTCEYLLEAASAATSHQLHTRTLLVCLPAQLIMQPQAHAADAFGHQAALHPVSSWIWMVLLIRSLGGSAAYPGAGTGGDLGLVAANLQRLGVIVVAAGGNDGNGGL